MKSFARNFAARTCWILAPTRRQVHLGCDFSRFAKDVRKVSAIPDPATKKEKPAEKKWPNQVPFHRDVPSYTHKIRNDTKVSAAVRVGLLSKGDAKSTVLVPEELRDPAEAMAACPVMPRRSELDQRRARKSQLANQLQALTVQKTTSSALAVQCVPFVKVQAHDSRTRSCDTVEDLVSQERDSMWLAKSFIKLKRDLQAERDRIIDLTEAYLELRAELYAKNMEIKILTEGKKTSSSSSSFPSVKPLATKIK